ncbi:zinc ABC transporter substrate-binding protein [Brevirhabdus sp.]|uniref:zinc ABC transporter substrate-binding protein n=1 Tax=Brevirhabdus sp. TaxID=2004514 RepID=UPI004059EC94
MVFYLRYLLPLFLALGALPLRAAPLSVATDIPAVHSLVSQITHGSDTSVGLLLDKGADPHDFQLRPSGARLLGGADVIVWTGPGLLPQLKAVIAAKDGTAVVLPLLRDEASDVPLDPHSWLDPVVAADWLDRIAATLSTADPDNATLYRDNALRGRAQLAALTTQLQDLLTPIRDRALLVQHDAYGPFARRFGLTIAGTLTDAAAGAPSAAHLAQIRARMARGDIACILREPTQSDALSRTVAEGHDVKLGLVDTEGNALPQGPDLYEALLRGIADAFLNCGGAPVH